MEAKTTVRDRERLRALAARYAEIANGHEMHRRRETLAISRDNYVELIFRDTCTLAGSMRERVGEACRILREMVAAETG